MNSPLNGNFTIPFSTILSDPRSLYGFIGIPTQGLLLLIENSGTIGIPITAGAEELTAGTESLTAGTSGEIIYSIGELSFLTDKSGNGNDLQVFGYAAQFGTAYGILKDQVILPSDFKIKIAYVGGSGGGRFLGRSSTWTGRISIYDSSVQIQYDSTNEILSFDEGIADGDLAVVTLERVSGTTKVYVDDVEQVAQLTGNAEILYLDMIGGALTARFAGVALYAQVFDETGEEAHRWILQGDDDEYYTEMHWHDVVGNNDALITGHISAPNTVKSAYAVDFQTRGGSYLENLQRYTFHWAGMLGSPFTSNGATSAGEHDFTSEVYGGGGRAFMITVQSSELEDDTDYTLAVYVTTLESPENAQSHYLFSGLGVIPSNGAFTKTGWNFVHFTTGTLGETKYIRLGCGAGGTSIGACAMSANQFAIYTGTTTNERRCVDTRLDPYYLKTVPATSYGVNSLGTVVCLGDSWTTQDYPFELRKLLHGTTVIDSGVGGERTDQMLSRFQSSVLDYSPSIMILLAGLNDCFQDRTSLEIQTSIQSIAALCVSNSIIPVLSTIPPSSTLTTAKNLVRIETNTWIELFAQANGYATLDVDQLFNDGADALKSEYDSGDHVHVNDDGDDLLAWSYFKILPVVKNTSPATDANGNQISFTTMLHEGCPGVVNAAYSADFFAADQALTAPVFFETDQSAIDVEINLLPLNTDDSLFAGDNAAALYSDPLTGADIDKAEKYVD